MKITWQQARDRALKIMQENEEHRLACKEEDLRRQEFLSAAKTVVIKHGELLGRLADR